MKLKTRFQAEQYLNALRKFGSILNFSD